MTLEGAMLYNHSFLVFVGGVEGRKRIGCFCKNECKQRILSVLVCSLWQGVRGLFAGADFFFMFVSLSKRTTPFCLEVELQLPV